MKYIKEYYDYSDMAKLPDSEIKDMAKTKKFSRFMFGKPEPEVANYTKYIKSMVFKAIPEFNNEHVYVKDSNNSTMIYFIITKEFDGRAFDTVLEVNIFHALKKLKVNLVFYINEDVYSDENSDDDMEENDKFLETIGFFDNRITFDNFESILNSLKSNISKYKVYCYGKYGVE